MIKVSLALKTILDTVKIIDSEYVILTDALNRVLSEDIYADDDIPGFDNSAMDGYAVVSIDVEGASRKRPKVLEVIADLKAGGVMRMSLKPGQSVRIMTGAPIPKGADSVVMVEDTKKMPSVKREASNGRKKEFVQVFREVKPQENIRKAGENIKKGELAIPKGTLLNPAHIGVLASLGKPKIKVARKPKVAILATGDEVIDVDEKLKPGKVRSSNTYTLCSQVFKYGGIPKNLGIAKDSPKELERKIKEGLDCDLILTSGGVSVGDYDLVKDVLAKMGTDVRFWKVAMRPGKPLTFGAIPASGRKDIPVLGLPGNPVSSMVAFEIFVRPALLKMLGQKNNSRIQVQAVIEENIEKKKGFTYFLRAKTRWDGLTYLTSTTGPQGSGILKSMAIANSLIIIPEDVEKIEKGRRVTVEFLS